MKKLIDFGLSDKEANIYISLLELEIASVSNIAKHSNINRSSAYVVLESLKKKGLVGVSDDKKIQRYVASSPDILLRSAKESAEKQEKIKEAIESVIPELKSLYKDIKHKPIVKVFEGQEATKEAYYNISLLKTDPNVKEIRVYENPEGYINVLPKDWLDTDYKERMRLGLFMHSIYPKTLESTEVIKRYRAMGSKDELIQIPQNKFASSSKFANLTICGDEVWFDSLKDNYCINIKKQEIADTLRNLFDLGLEAARNLKRKDR